MAPQEEPSREGGLYRPIPLRQRGSRLRVHRQMVERVTRDAGITKHDGDEGVARLDVCAFQSSV